LPTPLYHPFQALLRTEIFEKDLERTLNDAYDKMLAGDYGVGFKISKKDFCSNQSLQYVLLAS